MSLGPSSITGVDKRRNVRKMPLRFNSTKSGTLSCHLVPRFTSAEVKTDLLDRGLLWHDSKCTSVPDDGESVPNVTELKRSGNFRMLRRFS